MAEDQRRKYLKKAEILQRINIVYDSLEVIISLFAGFASGSAALVGWGLDSIVEVISGGTLWWRLKGELNEIPGHKVKRREKITLYVIAGSFFLISCFITYDAVKGLLYKEVPDWSTAGFIILVLSLFANPFLIWYKYKYGKKLNSEELIADSKDTFICLYQTVAVLVGLLAVRYLGLWWADPVAALLIVPYALKESRNAFKNGKKIKY